MIYETVTQGGIGITLGPALIQRDRESEEYACYALVLSNPEKGSIVITLEAEELFDLTQALSQQTLAIILDLDDDGQHIHVAPPDDGSEEE